MNNFVFAAFQYGLILEALLAFDAALPNSASAGDAGVGKARFAAVLLPPGTAPSEADECRPLICALQRNGYKDPLEVEKGGAAQIAVAQRPLRWVINKALDPKHAEVEVLLYYRGPMHLVDGALLMGAADAKFNLSDLVEKLAAKSGQEQGQSKRKAAVALLLDIDSQSSLQELKGAVSDVQRQFPMDLHVVIGRRDSASGSRPFRVVQELRRVLTYDREADSNADKVVTTVELATLLADRLRGAVDVGYVAPAVAASPMPVAWLGRSNLDEAIEDFSNEIVQVAQDCGAARVVIDDFAEQGQDMSSGCPGPLVPYITHQVRSRVRKTLEEAPTSVFVSTNMDSAGGTTAVVSGTVLLELETDPKLLNLAGSAKVCQEAGPSRMVALSEAVASLCVEEAGMSGHLNMSASAVGSAGNDWERIGELGASPAKAPHPMTDPDCPFRVYLESKNGTRFECRFSDNGRRMNVNVAEGDQYAIVIENGSDQDVFVRLLVDGRNTLPDHSVDDEPYEPAQYVSLTRARCWFCEAGTTYRIDGFYTGIDAEDASTTTGRWRAFRVTDVAQVSPTGDYRGQLGIITAAFYQAVAKADSPMASQPEFATCPGSAGSGRLDVYGGDLGPGQLLGEAPINIHYGFRSTGD